MQQITRFTEGSHTQIGEGGSNEDMIINIRDKVQFSLKTKLTQRIAKRTLGT